MGGERGRAGTGAGAPISSLGTHPSQENKQSNAAFTPFMRDYPMPEIKRVSLEDVVLKILLLNLGHPESFLKRCLEPPSEQQIRASIVTLADIGAVQVSTESWASELLGRRVATSSSSSSSLS